MENPQWKKIHRDLPLCDVEIAFQNHDQVIVISGTLKGKLYILSSAKHLVVEYKAAAAPTMGHSFTGNGVPYPSEFVAFEKSSNSGKVDVVNGKFLFSIEYPSAYMRQGGMNFVPPEVLIRVVDYQTKTPVSHWQQIYIGEGRPHRYQRDDINPSSYRNTLKPFLPPRSQYDILMSYSYPMDF